VLHNVGNVLNSVNVSADLIAGKVRDSEAAGLARAVKLLDEHADHIGEYLTHDARGRLLPGYLAQLVLALAEERRSIVDELAVLTKSVKHIKEIVATQQSYAGASSIVESAQICELLEDALRIDTGVPGYCEVTVQRRFSAVPTLLLDKHRVLLILVNLISNARHAMQRVPNVQHELGLSVEMIGETTLRVIVSDTGEGIAPDNLTRIFAHGFTTKQDGHGFGLHSCVLAAREMGGSLAAHSDGPGRGATFTLELPLQTASTETS
jgi:two-component system NtrC family sensor kinase